MGEEKKTFFVRRGKKKKKKGRRRSIQEKGKGKGGSDILEFVLLIEGGGERRDKIRDRQSP